MAMTAPAGRNAFGDPATGEVVLWTWNHKEEQTGLRQRHIDHQQPSIGRFQTVRAIRVQGASDPIVYKLAGVCPTLAQHQLFLRFQHLSLTQTIYFFHAAGDKFECELSDYEPQRQYFKRGARGEHYVWAYTLQLDVLKEL
jgi:hypothetical protein